MLVLYLVAFVNGAGRYRIFDKTRSVNNNNLIPGSPNGLLLLLIIG